MSGAAEDDDEAVLARLFLEELDAQRAALGDEASPDEARRALHKLKGSAGMVGHRALGDAFGRLERRLIAGDLVAREEAASLLAATAAALRAGDAVPIARWPAPPADLRPSVVDPSLAEGYRGAMRDRLARVDDALSAADPEDGAIAAFREIHAIKGAALAVGDEVVAWFCHGLEERLAGARSGGGGAVEAVREVARHRAVLGAALASPEAALATLRGEAAQHPSMGPPPTSLPLPPRRPGTIRAPGEPRTGKPADATVRVGADTLQDVFDRVSRLGQIPAPLASGSAELRVHAAVARDLHRELLEARRRIGPPRPWGPPAAAVDAIATGADRVAELAARLDRLADRARAARSRVASDAAAAQAALASMRTIHAATVFERLQAAAVADARRAGRTIDVVIEGGETLLDRELAEALADPLLQLARNAVAHGFEEPDERLARGKPATFQLRLIAEATAGSLTLTVEDDGGGVDLAEVRRGAVERGALAPELAALLDDVRLLAFLFRPGFSTRDDADLLAGRGLGLDVALAATHRAGGTLRLRTRRGHGFSAAITVPTGTTLLDVLWVRAGASWLAVPAVHVLEMRPPVPETAMHLAALVGQVPDGEPAGVLRLAARPRADADAVEVLVDGLGGRDEAQLRPIEPLVRATGPWSAAVVWGDEIRMVLDPQAVIDQAHALVHAGAEVPSRASMPEPEPTSLRLRT